MKKERVNKHKQIAQSNHAQRCDKFVQRSKKMKDIHYHLFHRGITRPDHACESPLPHPEIKENIKVNDDSGERFEYFFARPHPSPDQLQQELKRQVQQKMVDISQNKQPMLTPTMTMFAIGDPRIPTKTMRLYCLKKTFRLANNICKSGGDSANRMYTWNTKEEKENNETDNKSNCENMDDNENILTRIPCDVFLYCICNKYLYPNEVFLLLSVSKHVYAILTNNNNTCLHSLISNQRLIDY